MIITSYLYVLYVLLTKKITEVKLVYLNTCMYKEYTSVKIPGCKDLCTKKT